MNNKFQFRPGYTELSLESVCVCVYTEIQYLGRVNPLPDLSFSVTEIPAEIKTIKFLLLYILNITLMELG